MRLVSSSTGNLAEIDGCRCVNAGALSGIATTFLEKDVGYWAAFLMPTSVFAFGVFVFHLNRGRYGMSSPLQVSGHGYSLIPWLKSTNDLRGKTSYPLHSERCGTEQEVVRKWTPQSLKTSRQSTANPCHGLRLLSKSSKVV